MLRVLADRRFRFHFFSVFAALAGALLLARAASGQSGNDYYWTVPAGDWSVAANWGGTLPTSADAATIDNGGTATISLPGAQAYGLSVGDWPGPGAVKIVAGSLTADFEYVGYFPQSRSSGVPGTFTQSGGSNTVTTC